MQSVVLVWADSLYWCHDSYLYKSVIGAGLRSVALGGDV